MFLMKIFLYSEKITKLKFKTGLKREKSYYDYRIVFDKEEASYLVNRNFLPMQMGCLESTSTNGEIKL